MRHNLLFIIFVFCFGAVVGGCKSPAIVAPTVHNRDSVRIEYIYKLDSIYKDRWHTIFLRGDTVYRTDSIVYFRYKNIETHDTITVQHIDTITVRETIEKPMSGGSKFLLWSGVAMWAIIGIIVLLIIVAIAMRIRRV